MKSKFLPFLAVAASLALSLAQGHAATLDARGPKPQLRTDPTPVASSPGGPVASYADVVEPVERAVVSIYSSKTIHQRV